jgi:hypothetical protein
MKRKRVFVKISLLGLTKIPVIVFSGYLARTPADFLTVKQRNFFLLSATYF